MQKKGEYREWDDLE